MLLSSDCKAVSGQNGLCNDYDTANINALRIRKEYEGKGYISKLMKEIERYAVSNGISTLTIGVEANETRILLSIFIGVLRNFYHRNERRTIGFIFRKAPAKLTRFLQCKKIL